jgi:hypothetical protein
MKWLLPLLILAGCSTTPVPVQSGGMTCVHVSTLTVTTTAIYIAADVLGTIVVHPDCTTAITVQ